MDRATIGPILKKRREKEGLTIRQVAAKLDLAPGTISNMERGLPNVMKEKFIDYAKFLEIEEELFGIVSKEKEKERRYEKRLAELEYIASINPEKTLTYLDEIHNDLTNQKRGKLVTMVHFLRGICHFNLKNWDAATEHFEQVVEHVTEAQEGSPLKKMNLLSAAYNHLGIIVYFRDYNLIKALEYTQKGIDSFIHNEQRLHHYYLLLMNRPIYLEEMNENEKALQATKDLEKEIFRLDTSNILDNIKLKILVQLHDFYATIYNNLGLQEEALSHAFQGVKIAWINQKYDRLFSLWTTIGKIYTELGDIQIAKTYYQLALDIEKKVKHEKHLSFAYTNLSEMLLKEGKWEKSKQFAQKALNIGKNHPQKLLYIKALLSLGKWYITKEEYQNGLETLQAAEEICRKYQFKKERISIVANICTCYNGLNDQENYNKYTALLHKLITS